jgi:hypothetical protein
MSCKEPSEYQKFLKQWKNANITFASSAEMRKNWLKHASTAWNETKKLKEAEKAKKTKEHEAACKLRTTASPKVVGTPLRVDTANTASSLGLSPVVVPEKSKRTLQQCRLDLASQSAALSKRNASLCGRVCSLQQLAAPSQDNQLALLSDNTNQFALRMRDHLPQRMRFY